MEFDDDQSSTSSSSSSYDITSARANPNALSLEGGEPALLSHKKKAGRKKFKETRHPVYRGVRQRNGSKWVCEVREPNKKSRIWLGTFPTPEMAARAHDVAALALRGETAMLNFSDSAWLLPRAQSPAAVDIQRAAFKAAKAFRPCSDKAKHSSSSNVSFSHVATPLSIGLPQVNSKEQVSHEQVLDRSLFAGSSSCIDGSEKGSDISMSIFLDEEAIFNMPGLLDSMAEGMLLTPPAMTRGFNWDDVGHDIDLNLWMD